MKRKATARTVTKAVVAGLLATEIYVTIIAHYLRMFDRAFEMTFLSNFIGATVLAVAAVRLAVTGKDIPKVLYLDITVLLLVVLGICATFAPTATMVSTGLFLHLINPLFVAAFYFGLCDGRGIDRLGVASTVIFPALYFLFMIIFGRVTGGYVYIYFDPNRFGAAELIGIGFLAASITLVVAYGVAGLNGAFRRHGHVQSNNYGYERR